MNQSILEKISNQIPPCEVLKSWKSTKDIKVTLKERTQRLKREIDLSKKDLEKHLEIKRESSFDLQKAFIPVCVCRIC